MSLSHGFRGYVVGSNRGGNEWFVRIKDKDPQWNSQKRRVGSVHVGTNLKPGLDVSFRLTAADSCVHDVTALPPVEAKQNKQHDPAKRSDQASLNLIIVRDSDGKDSVVVAWSNSLERCQEEYHICEPNKEVIDFIPIQVGDNRDPALMALSALVWMNISDDEGFGQMFEQVLTQVYEAGRKRF